MAAAASGVVSALMTIAFSAVYGLIIGSFLTVVVDRVPRGASVVSPGSACGNCGLRLGAVDLVPVMSWLFLRGRCRRCRTSIGIEPLVLEVVTAALFAAMALEFGLSWRLPAFCVLAAGLVALTWIDLRTQRLPREITYVTLAVGVPLLVVAALVEDEPERILTMLLGAALFLGLLGAIYLASRGGMGDGDVRLSPLLGAFLGFLNPGLVPIALMIAAAAGSVVGLALMALRRAGRRTALPFGPFLATGTLACVFSGQRLVDAILG